MIDQVAAQSTLEARGPESHMLAFRAHHRLAGVGDQLCAASRRVRGAGALRCAAKPNAEKIEGELVLIGRGWRAARLKRSLAGDADESRGLQRASPARPSSRPPGHRRCCVGVSRHLVDRSHMRQAIDLFLQLPPSPLASSAALNPASSCSAAFHASDSPDARRVFPWLRHGLAETHPACSLAFSARTPNGIHGGPWPAATTLDGEPPPCWDLQSLGSRGPLLTRGI